MIIWIHLSLLRSLFLTYYRATCIRVSGEIIRTDTVWYVISYVTFCTLSTEIWTRIFALLSNTSLVAGALGVWYALRFAIWRSAYIFRQTAAGWSIVDHLTLGIWPAGWWLTRVRRRYYFFYKWGIFIMWFYFKILLLIIKLRILDKFCLQMKSLKIF